jgi:hypothetical protein
MGPVRPETTAHGGDGLIQQYLDSLLGFGLPARPTGQSAREHSGAARWHGRRDLVGGLGVAAAVASAPIEPTGHARQGGRGWSSPERRRGVEVVEDASGGGEAASVMDDVDDVALQC